VEKQHQEEVMVWWCINCQTVVVPILFVDDEHGDEYPQCPLCKSDWNLEPLNETEEEDNEEE
jgi:hypothetical protein